MTSREYSPEIHTVLKRLRRRIRRYIFLESGAVLLVVLGAAFWFSLGLDYAYFQLSHLELPRWFRTALDVAVIGLGTASLILFLACRLFRRLRSHALALLLERHFPELNDRLITAVEFSRLSDATDSPLTRAMLRRTVEEVAQSTSRLDLAAVFESGRLRRAILLAFVLVVSVTTMAFAQQNVMHRWLAAFVSLDHEYWSREYGLTVRIVEQPGDRIQNFKDAGNAFEHKHARGNELTLLVDVDPGKRNPERVELRYRLKNAHTTGRVFCSRVDDRHFKHSFGEVYEDLELWVTGGDYTNRKPYRVTLVEPPRVDQILLDSSYPEYTSLDVLTPIRDASGRQRDRIAVLGTQISLPVETDFLLTASCNKPLLGARIQFPPFELLIGTDAATAFRVVPTDSTDSGSTWGTIPSCRGTLETCPTKCAQENDTSTTSSTDSGQPSKKTRSDDHPVTAMLVVTSEEGRVEKRQLVPASVANRYFSEDFTSLRLPFILSDEATETARERIANLTTPFGAPFVIRPDTLIRIYLEDTDEIVGTDPARFTVNGIPDDPPSVETELRGIGSSVTRKATIPIAGIVKDDYGIVQTHFEYRIDDVPAWLESRLQNPPSGVVREFRLHDAEAHDVERFEVTPLDLAIGQTLILTLAAQDGDDLNGPHTSRGEKFSFRIVSSEELLSLLYQRELNLRQRFEQIITELKQTREDLGAQKDRLQQWKTLLETSKGSEQSPALKKQLKDVDTSIAIGAERSLQTIRKDANDITEIASAFRDIREEMVNNAVQTPQMLERIDERILAPLDSIISDDFPRVDAALGLLKLANETDNDRAPPLRESLDAVTSLVAHLEQVLLEMRKLETFQELIETLKAIIQQQEDLAEKTKSEQKKKLIEKLKGLGLD